MFGIVKPVVRRGRSRMHIYDLCRHMLASFILSLASACDDSKCSSLGDDCCAPGL